MRRRINHIAAAVVNIGNCQYEIIGGDLDDNDRSIYEYYMDENGVLTRGKSIGLTLTMTSFYSSDYNDFEGGWMKGSIIDITDLLGVDFINELISKNGLPKKSLVHYIDHARNTEKYDFKDGRDPYRGMPIRKEESQIVYASARDIGNYMAGYYASANGLSWPLSRLAFDVYNKGAEGQSSVNAQYVGWNEGNLLNGWMKGVNAAYSTLMLRFDITRFLMRELYKRAK